MIFVYIQLIHFTVQQKLTHYNTLQFKKKDEMKKDMGLRDNEESTVTRNIKLKK